MYMRRLTCSFLKLKSFPIIIEKGDLMEKEKHPAVHLTDLSRVKAVAQALPQEGKGDIPSDVNGSYTGTPTDGGTPVQDADDL